MISSMDTIISSFDIPNDISNKNKDKDKKKKKKKHKLDGQFV
jgi:hypothetical protein